MCLSQSEEHYLKKRNIYLQEAQYGKRGVTRSGRRSEKKNSRKKRLKSGRKKKRGASIELMGRQKTEPGSGGW